MGHIFRVTSTGPAVEKTEEPGCWLDSMRGELRVVRSLCLLMLDSTSPLTSRTARFEQLPGLLAGNRPSKVKQGPVKLAAPARPGLLPPDEPEDVWECELSDQRLWLLVKGATLRIVSRAEAFKALGACEVLHQMGLGDAAVALEAGDYDFASVQVIAERQRLKR